MRTLATIRPVALVLIAGLFAACTRSPSPPAAPTTPAAQTPPIGFGVPFDTATAERIVGDIRRGLRGEAGTCVASPDSDANPEMLRSFLALSSYRLSGWEMRTDSGGFVLDVLVLGEPRDFHIEAELDPARTCTRYRLYELHEN